MTVLGRGTDEMMAVHLMKSYCFPLWLSIIILLTLGIYVPEEFKNYGNTKFGTDHQSAQSGAGKVSWNKTAL